jgi:uncharacterized protein
MSAKHMADFYSKVFGWQLQFLRWNMDEYIVVNTSESDEKGRPRHPGTKNGGFYQKTADPTPHHPSMVIAVDDIHESVQEIKNAGGMVLGEPTEIPDIGIYVSFF